jgi:hypothetical protein
MDSQCVGAIYFSQSRGDAEEKIDHEHFYS